MLAVSTRFYVADEYVDEFLETFDDSMERLEERPGFVRFHVLTPADEDTDAYVGLTFWEDREAFDDWTNSKSFEESHSGETPDGMFTAPPEIEIHDVEVVHEPDEIQGPD